MSKQIISQENNLEFLKSYKVDSEKVSLPSGEQILIQKYLLNFNLWKGAPILNSYGNKAVIDFDGEPLFAELTVLRLFKSNGWDGVWVDSYRRKYRVGLPDVIDPVNIPDKQDKLINSIREKTGHSGGCWDLFLWKENKILFIELKRRKKDVIQDSQKEWLKQSLDYGLSSEDFAFLEWEIN